MVHIDMDAFFASVEQLTRPTLQGRPVLVGGASGRGVVAGASYEARGYGARSAMPMSQAVRLCRGRAVVVRPRFVVYSAASERIFGILEREAGFIERLSVDEGFAEPPVLVGATPEDAEQWAHQLQDTVEAETGLVCSIGVSTGKLHAKMASDLNKPHGVAVVPAARRDEIFGPRPVGEIGGIGPVAQGRLSEVGVTTIGQFTAMDDSDVRSLLGSVGTQLLGYARGEDPRPVAPRARAKQVSAERTLEVDVTTTAGIDPVLVAAATAAHTRLQHDGRAARTVTVKIRTADFQAHTRSTTLAVPTEDLDEIIAASRRVMPHPEQSGAVRLVGVSLSGLTEERQVALFPELTQTDAPGPVEDGKAVADAGAVVATVRDPGPAPGGWMTTQDVRHPRYGHGWVQGAGAGVVSVRFETRATGPGHTRTFAVDDPELITADPLDSLAWPPPTDTATPSGPVAD
ncbi:DNA polymerase IV [Corynebacterium terpenotabidum Y-11]|uniref:DNA polymerase IV n=1 Tax=Corynebacterium terpenotabidum Y-11 TaxID=1200352 RepID=S4XG12_9CORY|nr:DNA polymerase IV [Corynebacterium terpenotabidum Y-11]